MKSKISNSDRRSMMKSAWSIFNKGMMTFSDAMRVAWKSVKLRARMRTEVVRFTFRKVDGTVREALGTLMSDFMPETSGTSRKDDYTLQTYFDVEKGQYRCYSIVNLIR
jgi:hypothetical protein